MAVALTDDQRKMLDLLQSTHAKRMRLWKAANAAGATEDDTLRLEVITQGFGEVLQVVLRERIPQELIQEAAMNGLYEAKFDQQMVASWNGGEPTKDLLQQAVTAHELWQRALASKDRITIDETRIEMMEAMRAASGAGIDLNQVTEAIKRNIYWQESGAATMLRPFVHPLDEAPAQVQTHTATAADAILTKEATTPAKAVRAAKPTSDYTKDRIDFAPMPKGKVRAARAVKSGGSLYVQSPGAYVQSTAVSLTKDRKTPGVYVTKDGLDAFPETVVEPLTTPAPEQAVVEQAAEVPAAELPTTQVSEIDSAHKAQAKPKPHVMPYLRKRDTLSAFEERTFQPLFAVHTQLQQKKALFDNAAAAGKSCTNESLAFNAAEVQFNDEMEKLTKMGYGKQYLLDSIAIHTKLQAESGRVQGATR